MTTTVERVDGTINTACCQCGSTGAIARGGVPCAGAETLSAQTGRRYTCATLSGIGNKLRVINPRATGVRWTLIEDTPTYSAIEMATESTTTGDTTITTTTDALTSLGAEVGALLTWVVAWASVVFTTTFLVHEVGAKDTLHFATIALLDALARLWVIHLTLALSMACVALRA